MHFEVFAFEVQHPYFVRYQDAYLKGLPEMNRTARKFERVCMKMQKQRDMLAGRARRRRKY